MTTALSISTVSSLQERQQSQLLKGEILIETNPHTDWGGAVTAEMYIPLERDRVWENVTSYPQWVQYFPDLTESRVVAVSSDRNSKQIYHAARKSFLGLSVQVEAYLRVFERRNPNYYQIQFCLEQGNFKDFSADLKLREYEQGTLLTYSVCATPTVWVPSFVLQQAMRLDLPTNMRSMRRVICDQSQAIACAEEIIAGMPFGFAQGTVLRVVQCRWLSAAETSDRPPTSLRARFCSGHWAQLQRGNTMRIAAL